jgi:hypothetical protein
MIRTFFIAKRGVEEFSVLSVRKDWPGGSREIQGIGIRE